ncbi:MAG: beta-galactosidase [Verrucomicrobiae bacterium]|nr:beta-galactosidase [Verrucomicrobiae bacterium]
MLQGFAGASEEMGMKNVKLPFIYGAQYYRAPTPSREHWSEDLRTMADQGFNQVKFWAQWRWMNPAPGEFVFDDLDELMDLAREAGLGVTINVIFDVAPVWLFAKHPGARMIMADGRVVEARPIMCRQIGGYPGPCYRHPDALELRREFMRRVVAQYRGHAALDMWDVWNEPEYSAIWREPKEETLLCYCDACRRGFLAWLKFKYGELARLNAVWGKPYRDWDEVELPRDRRIFPEMIDWRLFHQETLAGEARWRVEETKALDPRHAVYLHPVPNTHSALNGITGVDDFQLAEGCDCFGGTTNGGAFSTLAAVGAAKGRLCYNVESHLRYGDTSAYPAQLSLRDFARAFVPQLGLGLRGFLHWQYRAETLGAESPAWGLLEYDGSQGSAFEGAAAFWKRLKPFADRLLQAPPEPAEALILRSSANEIFNWCKEGALTHLSRSCNGYIEYLYRRNVRVGLLDVEDFRRNGMPGGVRLLVLTQMEALDRRLAERLREWVAQGGVLFAETRTGAYDTETGRYGGVPLPGVGMAEAFGIRERGATAVSHLAFAQAEGSSADQGGADDVSKARRAFGGKSGNVVEALTPQGEKIWGWGAYGEIEGDDAVPLAACQGRPPCCIAKKAGAGEIVYAGLRMLFPDFGRGEPWRDNAVLEHCLSRSGARTSEKMGVQPVAGVRVDRLDAGDGVAWAASSFLREKCRVKLPGGEPLWAVFDEKEVSSGVALEAGQAEIYVPLRWRQK